MAYFNSPSQRTLGSQFVAISVALALTARSLEAANRPCPAMLTVRMPMTPISAALMVNRMMGRSSDCATEVILVRRT